MTERAPSAVADTDSLSLLRDEIRTLDRNLNRRLDDTEKTLGQRLDRQDRDLQEIKQQTQRTNGRVTTLEKARERAQGTMAAFSWLPPVIASATTAGFTLLIMALTGSLH